MMNQPIFPPPPGAPVQVILTRLHVRYSAATFPEDLTFQQTQDQENFQARYVIRHPWTGSPDACAAASDYFAGLRHRHETDAVTLAGLTGWDLAGVLKQAGLDPQIARNRGGGSCGTRGKTSLNGDGGGAGNREFCAIWKGFRLPVRRNECVDIAPSSAGKGSPTIDRTPPPPGW